MPLGEPDRRHPEADVAGHAHAGRLAAAAVGGAQLGLAGQLQAGLLGGDPVEHRLDGLGRDRHQRRLHEAEQRRLVLVGADDQRHRMRSTGARELRPDSRAPRRRRRSARRPACPGVRTGTSSNSRFEAASSVGDRRRRPDRSTSSAPTPSGVEELLGDRARPAGVVDRRDRRTLRDRRREQTCGGRAGQQRGHDASARGLAEQRHPAGVAAERGDVVAHPRAARTARRAGRGWSRTSCASGAERRQVEEAERAEPVVHRDDRRRRRRRRAPGRGRATARTTRGRRRRRAPTPSPACRRPARCPTTPTRSASGSRRPGVRRGRSGSAGRWAAGRPVRPWSRRRPRSTAPAAAGRAIAAPRRAARRSEFPSTP